MQTAYGPIYGVSINKQAGQWFYNQLVKIDIETGQSQTWFEDGCYPGEPIFVGAPHGRQKGTGLILSVVLNVAKGNSFLLILDAPSFSEMARAEIPQAVLFGYHGIFVGEMEV